MSTISLIFLIITITIIVVSCLISVLTKEPMWLILCLFSLFTFMIFGFTYWPDPTKADVRDGKAIYVTEKNIGLSPNGDTIYNYDTYKIEWLPEWEYGRKH